MQRHTIGKSFVAALLVTFISVNAAYAAVSYTVVRGDTMYAIAAKYNLTLTQLLALNPSVKNSNLIYPGQVLTVSGSTTSTSGSVLGTNATQKNTSKKKPVVQATTTPTTPTTPTTTVPVVPAAGESRFNAYITGYGWPDNTPAGGEIALPVIHSTAGGTGTYTDPITLAVGHVISGGKSTPDYAKGTKFYMPALRKYFIVEDLCGDGNTPQNGPCHTGYQGLPWLDVWVGGQGAQTAAVYACENAITGTHLVIQNPASNYTVASGAVYNGSACSSLYGDTVVTN